jgi:hypothetical protein
LHKFMGPNNRVWGFYLTPVGLLKNIFQGSTILSSDLLPTFIIRNRETTLGSIRNEIQMIRRNLRKEYGGENKTKCL